MTLEEERLRYEAALEFAQEALTLIHAAFNGENKLLMLTLAYRAMLGAKTMMGDLAGKLEEKAAGTTEFAKLLELTIFWNTRLDGLRAQQSAAKAQIIEVKF